MSSKSDFTKEELKRAREVIKGISNRDSTPVNISDPTSSSAVSSTVLMGLLGVCVLGAIVFAVIKMTEVPEPPTIRLSKPTLPINTPPPVGTTGQPQTIIKQAAPIRSVTNPATSSRPASQPTYTPAIQGNQNSYADLDGMKQKHADVARAAADRKFRYDYQLGSGNVRVMEVEIYDTETTPVSGWPRYRTEGKAGIAYYDSRGSFDRTTRSFEILTEVKSGTIKAVDISVK